MARLLLVALAVLAGYWAVQPSLAQMSTGITINLASLIQPPQTPCPAISTGIKAVYVQTNANPNNIEVWRRVNGGYLAFDSLVPTGGVGNGGAGVDPLGSQSSLVLSPSGTALFAVNFASNTVTAFSVASNGALTRASIVSTGGTGPVSLAYDSTRNVLYVLHASSVSVISVSSSLLLALMQNVPVPALTAPAQIGVISGSKLVVSNKAPVGAVIVWNLNADGTLNGNGATTTLSRADGTSTTPFAFVFFNNMLVLARVNGNEDPAVGGSDVVVYSFAQDNTLSNPQRLVLGQKATCWLALSGNVLFTANAASKTISRVSLNPNSGAPTLLGSTDVPFTPLDLAVSSDSMYLYALDGNTGSVSVYNADTNMQLLGSITSHAAQIGFNGIAAF